MSWGDPFLHAGGARLEAAFHGPGPGDAPTIVMLHEGLGCAAMWKDLPARLAAATGWGVCAYSRQGYGASDHCALPRPLDYMTREAVDVLPTVLDTIGFRHGILLGHSDGATIATIYAGSVQDHRVRGLALVAPHFFTEPEGLAAIAAAKAAYETGGLKPRLEKYHGANTDCAFRGWNDAWLDPGFRDWDMREPIAYIRVPILVVQGDADPYGTLAQVGAVEAEAYSPVDREILPGVGHDAFRDAPERALAILAEFTARLDRIERVPSLATRGAA